MRYHILLATILLLAVFIVLPRTTASVSASDFSVDVQPENVSVSIQLHMHQNITALKRDFSLPTFRVVAEGSNSTSLAQLVQEALRLKNPQAQVGELRLSAESTSWSNSTNLQWFNVTLTFNLRGVSVRDARAARVDMLWKSFVVAQDVQVGGVEVNRIGAEYLMDAARFMAGQQGSRFVTVSYQVMTRPVTSLRFSDFVAQMTVLNFSRLAKPLSQWQSTYVALSDKMPYSLTFKPSLGMFMTRTIQEPEAAETVTYGLFYSLNGQAAIPTSSTISGDTVTIIISEFPETLMGAIVVAAASLASGTYLYERRILNSVPRKRSKRKP